MSAPRVGAARVLEPAGLKDLEIGAGRAGRLKDVLETGAPQPRESRGPALPAPNPASGLAGRGPRAGPRPAGLPCVVDGAKDKQTNT